jgi:hypothetical protein
VKFISNLSKETLMCSELKVRDYKEILKCSFGDEPNKTIFVETLCDVFSKISNKPIEYFKQLSILDLFCLLVDVKINSHEEICKLIITKNEKRMNLELNLIHVKNEILDFYQKNKFLPLYQNDIEILLDCPSAIRLLENDNDDYISFIQGFQVTRETKQTLIRPTDNKQAFLLMDKFLPKTYLNVVNLVYAFNKSLSKINFLSRYDIKESSLTFSLSIDSLIWFTKLLFSEPLNVFYDNLFQLSYTGHINTEYLENSIVGEYNYFVTSLQQILNVNNKTPESSYENDSYQEDHFGSDNENVEH